METRMSNTQEKMFSAALKEIGVKEVPGEASNPRIIEYHRHTKLQATSDETPWCSAFINFCAWSAAAVGTGNAMARSWLLWGKKITEPEVGDVVVFSRGNDGISGHVGFVAKPISKLSLYVWVLGGNQGNQVCVQKYPKTKVLGYRRA